MTAGSAKKMQLQPDQYLGWEETLVCCLLTLIALYLWRQKSRNHATLTGEEIAKIHLPLLACDGLRTKVVKTVA
jgi:hypothetical protein